ncbi:MAG: hypothetical protein GY867_00545 [bacterium]|nr:hypothetical protein [bacterium]
MGTAETRIRAKTFVCGLLSIGLATAAAACGSVDYGERIEQHKVMAGELLNNRLYEAAIEEYSAIMAYDDVDNRQRANISYLIARVYFEDIKDFESAAAWYVRAREYDPEGSFVTEASKNLVASLEKLGNVFDARRQLSAATDVDNEPRTKEDVAVAEVGGRKVWLSEIEDYIASMPPQAQEQLVSREAKIEFIQQYVGVELLYNAAVREDFLSDPAIMRQQEKMLRGLLVDRYVAERVVPNVQIDTLDVHNFYLANKSGRYSDKPYDSVRSQVFFDYQSKKAEAAYSEYIEGLARAEGVQFFEQNVR